MWQPHTNEPGQASGTRGFRRGTIYLMVMVTVAIVTTLGLSSMALVRVQRRLAQATLDMMDAKSNSESALEHAAAVTELAPTWRATAAANGGVVASYAMGRGSFRVTATDPTDGDLTDSDSDPVDLVGEGIVGTTRQMYKVRLTPAHQPMSSLASGFGIVADKDIKVDKSIVVGVGTMFSNDKVDAAQSKVMVRAASGGPVTGTTYTAGTAANQPRVQMPDSSLFAYYTSIGTRITSSGMSGRRIENVLLSPAVNPYGTQATNPQGVYWLDCGNDDYTIRNCRIVGTLVLLNCSATTVVSDSVTWDAAVPGMPALLVDGKIKLQMTMNPLREAAISKNLNPSSTPYEGAWNATMANVYPSRIKGLVYVSGDLEVGGDQTIDGLLLCGQKLLIKDGTLSALYDDRHLFAPPPGFRSSTVMSLNPGSFTQVVE
jgi:hypothetical protein